MLPTTFWSYHREADQDHHRELAQDDQTQGQHSNKSETEAGQQFVVDYKELFCEYKHLKKETATEKKNHTHTHTGRGGGRKERQEGGKIKNKMKTSHSSIEYGTTYVNAM